MGPKEHLSKVTENRNIPDPLYSVLLIKEQKVYEKYSGSGKQFRCELIRYISDGQFHMKVFLISPIAIHQALTCSNTVTAFIKQLITNSCNKVFDYLFDDDTDLQYIKLYQIFEHATNGEITDEDKEARNFDHYICMYEGSVDETGMTMLSLYKAFENMSMFK